MRRLFPSQTHRTGSGQVHPMTNAEESPEFILYRGPGSVLYIATFRHRIE